MCSATGPGSPALALRGFPADLENLSSGLRVPPQPHRLLFFFAGQQVSVVVFTVASVNSGTPLPPLTSLIASRVPLLLHGERSQVWFKFLQTSPSRPVGLHQPTQQKCLGNILKIPVTGPLPQMRVGLLWGGVQGSESSVGDSGAGDLHQELRHCCVLGPPGAH